MNSNIGLLVVDRFDFLRANAPFVPKRHPVGNLTHERVAAEYAGFDGSVWPELDEAEVPLENGLAELVELRNVLSYVRTLPYAAHLDVLAVAREPGPTKEALDPGWTCVGVDIGYYESQWSYFSVLLNEVLYGVNPALTALVDDLNEHLLCNSQEQAAAILTVRNALLKGGADLELVGPAMRPMGIYVRADLARPSAASQK
jgi:hypothetical protein